MHSREKSEADRQAGREGIWVHSDNRDYSAWTQGRREAGWDKPASTSSSAPSSNLGSFTFDSGTNSETKSNSVGSSYVGAGSDGYSPPGWLARTRDRFYQICNVVLLVAGGYDHFNRHVGPVQSGFDGYYYLKSYFLAASSPLFHYLQNEGSWGKLAVMVIELFAFFLGVGAAIMIGIGSFLGWVLDFLLQQLNA